MADLDDLGYPSIIDIPTDEAIDLLRQIRLSRRVPDKPRKAAKETTKQTRAKVAVAVDANMDAELLTLLNPSGGEE